MRVALDCRFDWSKHTDCSPRTYANFDSIAVQPTPHMPDRAISRDFDCSTRIIGNCLAKVLTTNPRGERW